MSTTTARDTYIDLGEHIDLVQILTPGGQVASGQTWNGQLYGQNMAQDNITATHLGTQGTSLLITGPMARITTVASAGDSVTMPLSVRGMEIVLVNDAAANAANIFPALGDAINALGANAAFSLTVAAGPTIFYCYSNGLWRTK